MSAAVPPGYELKVKRDGQYVNEPPAAPKGWQYIKEVLYNKSMALLLSSDGVTLKYCVPTLWMTLS